MSDDHAIVEAVEVNTNLRRTRMVDEPDTSSLHPLVALSMGQSGELNMETLDKLLQLQERWEAKEAERAFTAAKNRLLDDLPATISKNKAVSFGTTNYSYADLPQVMRAVMPALRKHGFSVRWSNGQDGRDQIVTCHLVHAAGHEKTNERRSAVEPQKGMKSVQCQQATVTYLQRHTLMAILGIVADDSPDDDDDDDKPKSAPQSVDVERNLKAAGWIRKQLGGTTGAEEHVGRSVKDWTAADLVELKQWVKAVIDTGAEEEK